MYYYAYIDDVTGFCYDVVESDTLMNDPLYVLISGLSDYAEYMKCYKIRKKYVNGEWYDTTVEEAEQKQSTTFGEHIAIFDKWLNEVLDDKADTTHTHSEYSPTSHSHSEYATQVALDTLDTEIDGKADINHTHSNYATATSVSELTTTVAGKADSSHNHDSRYYTETEIDTKLATKSDASHSHTGVYDVSGAAVSALSSANSYTDAEIDALSETVATKASASTLTTHTGNTTIHITSTERDNWDTAKIHANSAHAPSNAEENQNAFSNVVVNGTTISADTKTDTLTFVAGSNVTITPDADGDSITISSANTVYTHPTSAGNKHIPAGGSSGQILRWSADGTAVWGNDNNTTYSDATQTNSGLMSDTDKTKLDGIAEGANNYILPSAGSSLGGVKTGGDVTISSGVITVNDDSHNHIISNIDGLQSALNDKAASSHNHNDTYYTETEIDTLLSNKANSSHTHTISNITNLQSTLDGKASTSHGTHVSYSTVVPVMDGSATVGTASTVARSDHKHPTDTTRASQTDLDALEVVVSGKAASNHTHSYAGSSSVGGAATSANKLNTNAGSATQPVYFANGIPVACTYTLGKSVPSNAVFTDTNTKVTNTLATTTKAYITGTTSATTNTGTQVFDTGVYLDTTAGKLTATTFNGTTYSGSGVATVSEVKSYLGF